MTDGSAGSLARELERFAASLEDAVRQLGAAHASGSRAAASSAAHRVLSLARLVGAEELCETASDLQGFAEAYTDAEMAREVGMLKGRAASLGTLLARAREAASVSPSSAS